MSACRTGPTSPDRPHAPIRSPARPSPTFPNLPDLPDRPDHPDRTHLPDQHHPPYFVQSPSRLPSYLIVIGIGCPPRAMSIFMVPV